MFGKNLRYLRLRDNLSQEELAQILGYKSYTTIQKWESGVNEPNMLVLNKLADKWNLTLDELVNVDLESKRYDYDTMASDIKQVIDAMKLKNITLIGHSMGSAIAIRYMAKYQGHNVSKLCLLASAAPSFVRTKDWYYGFTDTQIEELIKLTYNDRPSAITKIRNMTFYRYATPSTDEWFNLICLQASGWATAKSLIAFFEERLFDDLDKIKVPTLILHGVHDEICPYYFATYLNDHINDSILLKLHQSGHAAFFEEKELISDAINKFIQGHLIVPKESEEPI